MISPSFRQLKCPSPQLKCLLDLRLHLLALSYNVNTVLLYFSSADNFPFHMGFTKDKLTHLHESWVDVPIVGILFFSSILFLTNQSSFPKRLAALFGENAGSEEVQSRIKKIYFHLTSALSALYKSGITSTSFLALLNQFIGLYGGAAATAALLPGNFAAQFSILFEPYLKKARIDPSRKFQLVAAQLFAHYSSFAYAIANGALYFNAADLIPSELGLLSERIIFEKTPLSYVLLVANILFSLQFTYATYRSFSVRVRNLFHLAEAEAAPLLGGVEEMPLTFKERLTLRGTVAAFWKAMVTSLSMVALLSSYDMPVLGYILAALMLVGNYLSQLTLSAPARRVSVSPSWCSFFGERRQEEGEPAVFAVNGHSRLPP